MSEKEIPLEDITKLGLFFGRVSEVHLLNLKNFPWIFFNDLKQASIDYDIASKKEDKSWVSYILTISKENDHLDKRYKALESSDRSIFWKDVEVRITVNGKEVYKSE